MDICFWTPFENTELCPLDAANNNFRSLRYYTQVVTVHIQVFNLKVDPQLSREYFMSDAIYNGSAGMTL